MKSKKATKRALLSSALSLVLCFSMLLGTTFAWFTDTASTAVNVIQSGTLDVDLVDEKDATLVGETLEFLNANNEKQILWEPGVTFVSEGFKIVNKGNLALKYKLVINGIDGDNELLEVIDFWLTTDKTDLAAVSSKKVNLDEEFKLNPKDNHLIDKVTNESGVYYLVGHMDEEAGNEYQDLKLTGVGITVYATQVEAEVDSFDNKYDVNATYEPWAGDVASLEELMSVTDTENKTITISTAAQLAALAAYVNGDASMTPVATLADEEAVVYPPQTLKGYTVKLADNLNLNNMPWTPIGVGSAKFEGLFNGQGHTIYNLRVDAVSKAGLFGNVACSGRDAIVNLNVDGAIINSSHHAGVIAGSIYGNIDKCSVSDAVITLTTELTSNGYDNGDKAGGIVGYAANAKITNNTVTNVEIVGYRDIGGIVGCVAWDNYACEVTGNTVSCITLTLDGTNGYSSASANADAIVGSRRGETDTKKHVIENNSVDNVTFGAVVSTVEQLMDAVANGGKIVFAADIEVSKNTTLTVANGKSVNLDLNGYTLSGTADKSGNQEMFLVKGDMTVTNGNVEMTALNNQGWNAMAAIFDVTAGGELNMENVVAEVGGTDMNFIVHLNNWGEVTLNVDNCDFTASYVAVRAFNSGYDMNNVTIENTDFHGGRAFWVHNYTSEGKDDSTLNLDIYNNDNTTDHAKPVRFGFATSAYYDLSGNAIVSSAAALAETLSSGGNAVLSESLADAPVETTAPYGNYYGVALNGGVLDGNGNTLDFDSPTGDNYGVMTTGGTIKNVTITGVFRGIMIMNPTETVCIDNVTIGDEDVCYAINTGEGDGTQDLVVTNSTIKGWSSYGNAVKSVSFTNCTFAQGTYYTNVYGRLVKPYVNAVFENCEFNSKFYIDLSALTTDGDGNVVNPGAKVVLKNCTVNGVKLTAANWESLIASEGDCGEGQISIEGKDGSYMTADNVFDYVIIE